MCGRIGPYRIAALRFSSRRRKSYCLLQAVTGQFLTILAIALHEDRSEAQLCDRVLTREFHYVTFAICSASSLKTIDLRQHEAYGLDAS